MYFQRKLKGLIAACAAGEVPRECVDASVRGWINHVRLGNTVGLRKAVLGKGADQNALRRRGSR